MRPQEDAAEVAPARGTIAILEDEEAVSEDLEREISSIGYDVVGIADSLYDFERIVKTKDPDAVSIDWKIRGVDQGPDALDFMRREHIKCGRVVYTKYRDRARPAVSRWGADEVVIKESGDFETYINSMKRAIRIGLLRRIVGCLIDLGVAVGITVERVTKPLDHEREIFSLSRRTLMEKRISGKDPSTLRKLLYRRGWWEVLDLNTFITLPWPKKLEQLIRPLNLDSHYVSVILGVREDVAQQLILGDIPLHGLKREEMDRVDLLQSVLAHVLRMSQYDLDMMPHYWNVRHLYGEALRHPPWDSQGLGEFLAQKGPSGLSEALSWIRR